MRERCLKVEIEKWRGENIMKQSLVKKLTAGILTGALAISVTACGGN